MVGELIKKVLKFILVLIGLGWLAFGTLSSLTESQKINRYNLRFSYPSQQELILNAINLIVATDCGGSATYPWYCDHATFTVDAVVASHEELFAIGKGLPRSGGEFWWLGVKREAQWSEILLQDEGEALPQCEEISEIPSDIFSGFFRYCLEGVNRIDRSSEV